MNKLQQLTERINELVPENKLNNQNVWCGCGDLYQKASWQPADDWVAYECFGCNASRSKDEYIHIEPRITLEVVLMAISNHHPDTNQGLDVWLDNLIFETPHLLVTKTTDENVEEKIISWELGKNLDQQSPEVIDLLTEILIN